MSSFVSLFFAFFVFLFKNCYLVRKNLYCSEKYAIFAAYNEIEHRIQQQPNDL